MRERPLSTLLPQLWRGMVHAVSAVSMGSLVVLTQNSDLLLKVRPKQIGCNVVFVFFPVVVHVSNAKGVAKADNSEVVVCGSEFIEPL